MGFENYCEKEHQELLEPVIELIESYEDAFTERASVDENGYYHQTDSYKVEVYGYRLGRVYGRGMYDQEELPQLYKDAFKSLKLDGIIKNYADQDDEWTLTDIWEAPSITITTEAIRNLYYTDSENERLNILERALEACELSGQPVVDAICIRLSREALKLEKDGGLWR